MGMRLNWKGKEAATAVKRNVVAPALGEIGLRVETAAKRQLYKGHGVRTGTLRRSIHTATPGYNWQGDNMEPSASSPERGGQPALPEMESDQLVVQVGSGLRYALFVHQGDEGFEGYHYLVNGVEEVRPQVPAILQKHRARGGEYRGADGD